MQAVSNHAGPVAGQPAASSLTPPGAGFRCARAPGRRHPHVHDAWVSRRLMGAIEKVIRLFTIRDFVKDPRPS